MQNFFIPILLLILNPLSQKDTVSTAVGNKYVSYAVVLKEKTLKVGETGTLLISLTPQKGFHITFEPSPSVQFATSDVVASTGKLGIIKMERDEYLDLSKPLKQPFTLSKKSKSGFAAIKGTLTYFYCSEKDRWCSKFKQPFELQITITK